MKTRLKIIHNAKTIIYSFASRINLFCQARNKSKKNATQRMKSL